MYMTLLAVNVQDLPTASKKTNLHKLPAANTL